MKTIITVQHTQSVHHVNGMVGSWTDWDLTDLGREQADRIGRKLGEELSGKDVTLYSSDLKRAAQTAREIAKYLGVRPVYRRELRERNLGECCGKSVAWLREHVKGPEKTVDDRLFPDGESRRDAWERLRPFFDEVMEGKDGTFVLVSHGDLLSIWNAMFLGLPPESLERTGIRGRSGGVSIMTADGGMRRIERIGDLSYMLSGNETDGPGPAEGR